MTIEHNNNEADFERLQTLNPRLAAKISVDAESGCWAWTAGKNGSGYGYVRHHGRCAAAHRVVYALIVDPDAPIWPGRGGDALTLDHLCRSASCVNPHHVELVSNRTNVTRGRTSRLGDTSSAFVGVSWERRVGKWQAQIRHDGRPRHLGLHATEHDAAMAYDAALLALGLATVNGTEPSADDVAEAARRLRLAVTA
jgi:hypothetical protein